MKRYRTFVHYKGGHRVTVLAGTWWARQYAKHSPWWVEIK